MAITGRPYSPSQKPSWYRPLQISSAWKARASLCACWTMLKGAAPGLHHEGHRRPLGPWSSKPSQPLCHAYERHMPIIHDACQICKSIHKFQYQYTVTIKNGLYCEVNVAPQIIFARAILANAAHPAQLRHEATKWAIENASYACSANQPAYQIHASSLSDYISSSHIRLIRCLASGGEHCYKFGFNGQSGHGAQVASRS